MFKITFTKDIKLGPGKGSIVLEREMFLPLMPMSGQKIIDSDAGFQAVIKQVVCYIAEGLYECTTEPDMEIYDAKRRGVDHRTAREIIDNYQTHGWVER